MRTMQAVFRKREAFAPLSSHKSIEEIVDAGRGANLEVIMSWGERVLQIAPLGKKANYSLGYLPSNDIVLPSLPGVPASETCFGWSHNQLFVSCNSKLSIQLVNEDKISSKASPVSGLMAPVLQGQFAKVEFENGFSVSLRYKGYQQSPKIIPLFDFSSQGFWSLFLSTLFSGWISLWFSQKTSTSQTAAEVPMTARLLITTPIPVPVRPKPSRPRPVKAQVATPKPKTPVIKSSKISKSKRPPKAGANAAKGPRKKTPKKIFAQTKGAKGQPARGTERVARSALFASLGGSKKIDPDGGLGDSSSLSVVAEGATGKSGKGSGQGWQGSGSHFKDVEGRGAARTNVGVGHLKGRGRAAVGMGPGDLGKRSQVAIHTNAQSFATVGTIDKEAIRKVFFQNARVIRYCYESQLNRNSRLQGKVVLDFEIGEQGRVVGTPRIDKRGSTVANSGLAQCLLTRLKMWSFPEPPKNQVVQVLYPLAFSQ